MTTNCIRTACALLLGLLAVPAATAAVPTLEIGGSFEAGSGIGGTIGPPFDNRFGVFGSAAGTLVEITPTGRLFAPPDSTGRAIRINGQLVNLGRLEAGFGFEINGLTIAGLVTNLSQGTDAGTISAHTLAVLDQGQLVNVRRDASVAGSHDAVLNTGTYPIPGIGQVTGVTPSGRAQDELRFIIAEGGSIQNRGVWNSYGHGSVLGILRNTGTFVSRNNPNATAGGTGTYLQDIAIGRSFGNVPLGELTNIGSFTLESGTKMTVNGRVENFGTMTSRDVLQVGRLGTFENLSGGFLDLYGYTPLSATFRTSFLNQGEVRVRPLGILDNLGTTVHNASGGTITVDQLGILRQTRRGSDLITTARTINEGTMFVSGQFLGGWVRNSGRIVIAPTQGAIMDVDFLHQTDGTLAVNGTFTGDLSIEGGVLAGGGPLAEINGSVFVGGMGGGPTQEPPNCGAVGYACFRPGNSPGHLTIDGPLVIGANGVLELEIERDANGLLQWDTVSASSIDFQFRSIIEVVIAANVGDITGQTFSFLDCGLGCTYDGVTTRVLGGAGDFAFGIEGLVFTAAPVPEPRVWTMLAIGLFIAGLAARRRARNRG